MQTAGMVTFDRPPRWMPILPAPEHAPAVPPPSTCRILHRGERPPRDAPPRQPASPHLTQRYLLQRLDAMEDNQRRIAAHLGVELAPRMPNSHFPSDPEDDTDTEPDEGADEDEENVPRRSGNEGKRASESRAGEQTKKSRKVTLGGTPIVETWPQALRAASSAANLPYMSRVWDDKVVIFDDFGLDLCLWMMKVFVTPRVGGVGSESPSGGRFPGRDIADDNHDDQIVYIASTYKNI
ncbi:hypothetical protein E3N88_00295 [Mikania micrantha]|uniref:Uncharacterized protein n=1 Tax=Mikania micrantha TaxID=192012 RepID=A0A5N6PXP9_9ASTR|nr:hypothetical protein E3N88_00295 [Mikania micrantha]